MIVVTGGAGFIGSALVWKLNREGIERVLVVDHLGSGDKWKNLAHLKFDDFLPKEEFLRRIEHNEPLPKLSAVVHFGACSSTTERDADYLLANNYRYSRVVAQWCLERDVRMVYASSAATYGDGSRGYCDDEDATPTLRPLNAYGYSKQLFDAWALRSGALEKIVGLKFFNVFGPNEYHKGEMRSVAFKAFHQIQATGCVQLFRSHRPQYADGGQQRDFIYVKDCVEAVWWLLQARMGGLFNLGTGQARTFNDLAAAVFAALGRPPRIEYIPMPEVLRDRYQYFTQADMRKLRATGCPLKFTPLEDAIKDYVGNYLAAPSPYLEAG